MEAFHEENDHVYQNPTHSQTQTFPHSMQTVVLLLIIPFEQIYSGTNYINSLNEISMACTCKLARQSLVLASCELNQLVQPWVSFQDTAWKKEVVGDREAAPLGTGLDASQHHCLEGFYPKPEEP